MHNNVQISPNGKRVAIWSGTHTQPFTPDASGRHLLDLDQINELLSDEVALGAMSDRYNQLLHWGQTMLVNATETRE